MAGIDYLTRAQTSAAAAGLAVTIPAAIAVGNVAGPEVGALGFAANFLYAAVADVVATAIRHRGNVVNLAWRKLDGRGGHVGIVGAGLGVTFGTSLVDPLIHGATHLAAAPHASSQELFWRLVFGIQPMAFVVAAKAPVGTKLNTLVNETLANLTGSALATMGLPIWDQLVQATVGNLTRGTQAIANQIHYVMGYLMVLSAMGWSDRPSSPAVQEEVAAGRAARSA